VHVRPAGVEEAERLTVPVKPLTEVSVTVIAHEAPGTICEGLQALAPIVKSGKLTVICLVPEKLVPITLPTIV
jgi:hypothetical protein